MRERKDYGAAHDEAAEDDDGRSSKQKPRERWLWPAYVFWGIMVGVSVTMRTKASMYLSSTGKEAFIDSFCVACVVDFLSVLVLLPFSSFSAYPTHSGPLLASLCTLPSATLIAASRTLGQFIVQMLLKFGTLSSAFALDVFVDKMPISKVRAGGAVVVLAGVFVAGSDNFTPDSKASTGSAVLISECAMCALLSGASFVMAARFCMPPPDSHGPTILLASYLYSGLLQIPALIVAWFQGTMIQFRFEDISIWALAAFQGAFYMYSMQVLPRKIGYAATFTASLSTQLFVASFLEVGLDMSPARSIGFTMVLGGAILAEASRGFAH